MQDILHAIKLWIIRLFETKIEPDENRNEIEYLRMELVKKDDIISLLQSYIMETNKPEVNTASNTEDMQPIQPRYIPFEARRRQLEIDDRKKAAELAFEKAKSEAGKKTTAELEDELLNGAS